MFISLLQFKHGQVCSDLQPEPPDDYDNSIRDGEKIMECNRVHSVERDIDTKVRFDTLKIDCSVILGLFKQNYVPY